MDEVRAAFATFLSRLPFYGLAVLCADHPETQALLPRLERRAVTYGFSPQAGLRAVDLRHEGPATSFEVIGHEGSRGRYRLHMLGAHNVSNALAALAVAEELGVEPDVARAGLEGFEGVDRRFSVRGEVQGVMVVDDYAHHPAEIAATLDGARRGHPGRRLVAIFQPHRYTRTRDLLPELGRAFGEADLVFVLPVYGAGERPIEGADRDAVVDSLRGQGHRDARALDDVASVPRAMLPELRPGDLVIALGAGDVGRSGRALVELLESRKLPDGSEKRA